MNTWSARPGLPSWAITPQHSWRQRRLLYSLSFIFLACIFGMVVIQSNTYNTYSARYTLPWNLKTESTPMALSKTPISSLLSHPRHPNAKNVSIHFINHHFGTASELRAIARAIGERNGVTVSLKETWGIYETVRSLYVPKAASNDYWPIAQKVECNPEKYDIVVVGDTMSLIRPHLQNCCPLKMVASLTTRYDWAHDNDMDWKYLVSNASTWRNFRIHPNNLIEPWYAEWKQANIKMHNYLPSSGVPSAMWSDALRTINFTTSQPDDNNIIVPTSVRSEECLASHLRDLKIKYTTFDRNKYGGPLGLTDRIVVHFPYQSNTMSLFENLHQRVIYILPTLRLFREMQNKCSAKLEKIPNTELTDEQFYNYVDWWRRDLQPLFYYFDNYTDLLEGSELRRRVALEADIKRVQIGDFMVRQKNYVLEQWENILFTDWHKTGEVEQQCIAYNKANP